MNLLQPPTGYRLVVPDTAATVHEHEHEKMLLSDWRGSMRALHDWSNKYF